MVRVNYGDRLRVQYILLGSWIMHINGLGLREMDYLLVYLDKTKIMYDSGCPCSDAHGMGSRLSQGERSLRTYFPK